MGSKVVKEKSFDEYEEKYFVHTEEFEDTEKETINLAIPKQVLREEFRFKEYTPLYQ